MGVLLQANYGSILGVYGLRAKSVVKRLYKENLISFLGTDVHRENSIYPKVPKALNKILKIVDDVYIQDITTNNALKILNGEKL